MFLKSQHYFITACLEKWSFHSEGGGRGEGGGWGSWAPSFWIFWILPWCTYLQFKSIFGQFQLAEKYFSVGNTNGTFISHAKFWAENPSFWECSLTFLEKKMYGKFSKFHALNSCCSTKQYSMYPGCQRFFSQWANLAAKLRRRVVTSTSTSTTRSDAPRCWRARRPLASRVYSKSVTTEKELTKNAVI